MAVDRNESFASIANKVCKEFVFFRQDIAFWKQFSDDYPLLGMNAKVQVVEQAQGGCVMMMTAWLLDGHKQDVRKESEDIEFPATPWQFFKKLYMPKWFVRRWPVRNTTTRLTVAEHHHYLCPHVPVEDSGIHFRWMAQMSGQWGDDGTR